MKQDKDGVTNITIEIREQDGWFLAEALTEADRYPIAAARMEMIRSSKYIENQFYKLCEVIGGELVACLSNVDSANIEVVHSQKVVLPADGPRPTYLN